MFSMRTKRVSCTAIVSAAAVLALGSPARADYGGSVSSTVYGAQFGYTVTRMTLNRAQLTGVIRDVRADGYCAYVRVTVPIDWALDPVKSKTICGRGNTAAVSMYTFDYHGLERVQGIRLKVCRRDGSRGSLRDCRTTLLTRTTN